MDKIVKEYKTKLLEGTLNNEDDILIKLLLFDDMLDIDSETRKLFLNTVYQNKENLSEESIRIFDYYVRTRGYFSHSLQKKEHLLDAINTYDTMKLSQKQRELLSFIETMTEEFNFVSAPTSFGKTKLVLETLVKRSERAIVLVPTKSLINEYKANLSKLNIEHHITSNPSFNFCSDEKYIFVCTQERLNISNCLETDILVIDEAQNIESINANRTLELIVALKSIKSRKVFLSPYIELSSLAVAYQHLMNEKFKYGHFTVSESNSLVSKRNYYVTATKQNILIKYDVDGTVKSKKITRKNEKEAIHFCMSILQREKLLNQKNIIYTASKNKARLAAKLLIDISDNVELSRNAKLLIEYFENEYSSDFEIIDMIKKGLITHTADLDPFARRVIESIYNDTEFSTLNNLISTSTIAAGVNLQCQNLFYITKRSGEHSSETRNILGRSGRFNVFNVGANYYFPYLNNTEITEAEEGQKKLIKIEKKDYDQEPNTTVQEDLIHEQNVRKKIYKYFVSTHDYKKLKSSISKISTSQRQSILMSPLKHKNLVFIFENYYRVVNPNRENSAVFYAVIFEEYLSGKSYYELLSEKINIGFYYDESNSRFHLASEKNTIQFSEQLTFYSKENITKEIKNELLYQIIRNTMTYCEYELKRVITVILFIIEELEEISSSILEELNLNFEYGTKVKEKRDFIIHLSELGIDDKFLVNAIMKDPKLKCQFKKVKTKYEAKNLVKTKFGKNSYHYLGVIL